MAKVYTHATLTIVARRGNNASHGFLQPKVAPSGTTYIRHQNNKGSSVWITLIFADAVSEEEGIADDTRGWTMQEYMLSRRVIVCGTWATEIHCQTERSKWGNGWFNGNQTKELDLFHHNGEWKNPDSPPAIFTTSRVIGGSHLTDAIMFFSSDSGYNHRTPDRFLLRLKWNELIGCFTARSLSYPEDRSLVISGLAEKFEPTISRSKRHIAALWESEMPGALLRRSHSTLHYEDTQSRYCESPYLEPSWSWASVEQGPIKYDDLYPTYFSYPEQSRAFPIRGVKGLPLEIPTTCVSRVETIQFTLADPKAPYGKVSDATLCIRGPAYTVRWQYLKYNTRTQLSVVSSLRGYDKSKSKSEDYVSQRFGSGHPRGM
jgi:hypothetical protein